jgi:hypothetical protein
MKKILGFFLDMEPLKLLVSSLLVGSALFIAWHFLMNLTWDRSASADIVSGAIIEFFLFQIALEIYGNRQLKLYQKKLNNHLRHIESLLHRANSSIDEVKDK